MKERVRRKIETVMFDGPIGLVTSHELVSMEKTEWGMLRDRITDKRSGKKDGLTARCMACGSHVFISTRDIKGDKLPFFAHYKGGDPNCPWHHGETLSPDSVRAAQYHGQQESIAHRIMCEKIAEIISLDPRCLAHKIEEYILPTQERHGRFPDVYGEWQGFGKFVVEVQCSNTFQTEISERCKFYEEEKISLLWILYGFDPQTVHSQSFEDVIRRHRGNAFVLDHEATQASYDQKTLVLTVYLQKEGGFDKRLVRFDNLIIPKSYLPFCENRIGKHLAKLAQQQRAPWFEALQKRQEDDEDNIVVALLTKLPEQPHNAAAAINLIAVAFSIVAEANKKWKNYVSRQPNIRAMLNSYLSGRNGKKHATLLRRLIEKTSAHYLLAGTTGDHLLRAEKEGEQVEMNSPEWRALAFLLPEALDARRREELIYFEALPNWATPPC